MPEKFDGAMDFDSIESFLWSLDNYFKLLRLTDPNQQACFAITYMTKSAALWMQIHEFDF